MTLSVCLGLFASSSWAFSLDDVATKAEKLAAQGYEAPKSNLPPVFRNMAFGDYQQLRFRGDKALWHDAPTPFELQFYHQGMHFDVPVTFDFGKVEVDHAALENLGFSGFKVLYPLNKADKADELMTLLGASYFRVVGKGQCMACRRAAWRSTRHCRQARSFRGSVSSGSSGQRPIGATW